MIKRKATYPRLAPPQCLKRRLRIATTEKLEAFLQGVWDHEDEPLQEVGELRIQLSDLDEPTWQLLRDPQPNNVTKLHIETLKRRATGQQNTFWDLLRHFPMLRMLEITANLPGSCFALWVGELASVLSSGGVSGLCEFHAKYNSRAVISSDDQQDLNRALSIILPRMTGVTVKLPNPLLQIIEETVLPNCCNLESLQWWFSSFESLQRFMQTSVFTNLRQFLSMATVVTNAAQAEEVGNAIQAHLCLRSTCISGWDTVAQLPSYVQNTGIVALTLLGDDVDSCTASISELVASVHSSLRGHALDVSFAHSNSRKEFGLQIASADPALLKSLIVGLSSSSQLLTLADLLRHPKCAIQRVTLTSDLSPPPDLWSAVSESHSLQEFYSESPCPDAYFVKILQLNEFLKNLVVSGGNEDVRAASQENFVEAIVRNEVLEHILPPGPDNLAPLCSAVSRRNASVCIRNCRMLWLAWLVPWQTDFTFEPLLALEVVSMAELDWAEAHRAQFEVTMRQSISKRKPSRCVAS